MMEKTYRPNRGTLGFLAICMWPLVIVGIWGFVDGQIISGSLLAIGFSVAWLNYATQHIVVGRGGISVHRFGRQLWRAHLRDIDAHYGRGGEMGTHTALIIRALGSGRRAEILKTIYGYAQMVELGSTLGAVDPPAEAVF